MSQPKVTITPVVVFHVSAGGTFVGEFKKHSEWNGYSELRNSGGEILIVNRPDSFTRVLNQILQNDTPEECDVVKASTRLSERIQSYANDQKKE